MYFVYNPTCLLQNTYKSYTALFTIKSRPTVHFRRRHGDGGSGKGRQLSVGCSDDKAEQLTQTAEKNIFHSFVITFVTL